MILRGSLYQVLRLPADADADAVDAAYRAALQALVTGEQAGWGHRLRAWLTGRTRAGVEQAHAVLRDPVRRAAYDRALTNNLFYWRTPPAH